MPELNQQQFRYVHRTDAELKPGDVLRPAAETGHQSRYQAAEGYDPHRVYVADTQHEHYDPSYGEHYGRHTYAVEPLGRVQSDPEVQFRKSYYRARPEEAEDMFPEYVDKHNLPYGSGFRTGMLGGALAHRTTNRALVVKRL